MFAKAKISKGGKISIPSICRKALNVSDGDELLFDISDNQVVISPVKFTLQKIRKLLKDRNPSKTSLVDELLQERKQELKNE
ncbi:MAG: AbrB/MazE/SpoVT family DNA-binding domain-containing protein [Rickettsiales bacterium]|nr:MAG: AbrB/MazE/SpoVT family DNA-binding domain-containing protein [Rickettsiales bacterium]